MAEEAADLAGRVVVIERERLHAAVLLPRLGLSADRAEIFVCSAEPVVVLDGDLVGPTETSPQVDHPLVHDTVTG